MTKQSKLSEAFQNYWCPAELGIFKCMISWPRLEDRRTFAFALSITQQQSI